MKIKLLIADNDKRYVDKLIDNLTAYYSQKLEISSFTDIELVKEGLKNNKPDIILASEKFDEVRELVDDKTIFAYLTEHKTQRIGDVKAICKYQRTDVIYQQILNMYSEIGYHFVQQTENTNGTRIISFFGITGGAGASTLAAAYATRRASQGIRTLLLDLEKLVSTKAFFDTSGEVTFDEVIFGLKSKKINFGLKVESSVKKDTSGLLYFTPGHNFIDMLQLEADDISTMLHSLCDMGQFDEIVVDSDLSLDDKWRAICAVSSKIVMVCTGMEVDNSKLEQFIRDLDTLEERMELSIKGKLVTIYNRFHNSTGHVIEAANIANMGGIPDIKNANALEIKNLIAEKGFWNSLDKV